MYKLKNSYIDKMIKEQISSKSIDFILYIARSQSDSGLVSSVYYKDVCENIHISYQTFYDILKSLQSVGLISYDKKNSADISVKLLENDFSQKDFHSGYLNVACRDFKNEKFMDMKAGSKLLYLYMQRYVNGKHMSVMNFYEKFCELFNKKRKSIQIYLHELKENTYLYVSKKRNKSNNYEMNLKNSKVLNFDILKTKFEKSLYLENIKEMIRRNFKKNLPEDNQEKVLNDIASLAVTKKASKVSDISCFIVKAIMHSISKQKEEGKKYIYLNAALVNTCLSNYI